MEIELKENMKSFWISALVVLVLISFGAVGRLYTPLPARLFTWEDWSEMRMRQQHERELAQLTLFCDRLANALNEVPDAVKVQVLVQSGTVEVQQGTLPTLNEARGLVLEASVAVRDWSVGKLSREEALVYLDLAVESLHNLDIQP